LSTPANFTFEHQYIGNPSGSANSAAPIPITITVQNDPNINFVNEKALDVQVQAASPGTGLGGFTYNTTPPATQFNTIVFRVDPAPPGSNAPPALILVNELPTPPSEAKVVESRQVVLNIVSPGGNEHEAVRLPVDVLSDMPSLFKKLPDGRYRLYLTEPGSGQRRMVIDVELREGRPLDPADENEGSRDQTPSTNSEPASAPSVALSEPVDLPRQHVDAPQMELPRPAMTGAEASAWIDVSAAQRSAVLAGVDHDELETGVGKLPGGLAEMLTASGVCLVAGASGRRGEFRGPDRRVDDAVRGLDTVPLGRVARLLRRWRITPM
jgi:hypothetical protein